MSDEIIYNKWISSELPNKDDNFTDLSTTFKVVNDAFVQTEWNQYIKFIDVTLNDYIKSMHKCEININDIFYRGRPGIHSKIEEIKAPPAENAKGGRLNPVGLPMLYIASDINTCLYEVHQEPDTRITVGKFTPKKDLALLDLTHEQDLKKQTNDFRKIISENFSRPVTISEKIFEYLPTQLIALYIKDYLQYDGVKYPSSLISNGYNIVLFDVNSCNIELLKEEFKAK